jgi:hypothetical protein
MRRGGHRLRKLGKEKRLLEACPECRLVLGFCILFYNMPERFEERLPQSGFDGLFMPPPPSSHAESSAFVSTAHIVESTQSHREAVFHAVKDPTLDPAAVDSYMGSLDADAQHEASGEHSPVLEAHAEGSAVVVKFHDMPEATVMLEKNHVPLSDAGVHVSGNGELRLEMPKEHGMYELRFEDEKHHTIATMEIIVDEEGSIHVGQIHIEEKEEHKDHTHPPHADHAAHAQHSGDHGKHNEHHEPHPPHEHHHDHPHTHEKHEHGDGHPHEHVKHDEHPEAHDEGHAQRKHEKPHDTDRHFGSHRHSPHGDGHDVHRVHFRKTESPAEEESADQPVSPGSSEETSSKEEEARPSWEVPAVVTTITALVARKKLLLAAKLLTKLVR